MLELVGGLLSEHGEPDDGWGLVGGELDPAGRVVVEAEILVRGDEVDPLGAEEARVLGGGVVRQEAVHQADPLLGKLELVDLPVALADEAVPVLLESPLRRGVGGKTVL